MGKYASMLTVCGLSAAMFWGADRTLNVAPLNLIARLYLVCSQDYGGNTVLCAG